MKKATTLVLMIVLAFNFTSCSENEELVLEPQTELLKSYTVKKDQSGSYFLEYKLSENATAENVINKVTNVNEFHLYESDNQSKRNFSKDMFLDDDQLKIGFVNTNSDKKSYITIVDDHIVFAKDKENKLLKDYSITSNGDTTYQLNFNVKEDVAVSFVYNEEEAIYEIHLQDGSASNATFSRTFTKDADVDLKIDFINHTNSSRNIASKEDAQPRKPRMIIIDM